MRAGSELLEPRLEPDREKEERDLIAQLADELARIAELLERLEDRALAGDRLPALLIRLPQACRPAA